MEEMLSHGEILQKLSEVVTKLTDMVEQIAIQTNESAENSFARLQTSSRVEISTVSHSTPAIRPNSLESLLSGSYVPKIVKIDFLCYDCKGDPTIWLFKADQFFQLHGIPVLDRVALVSFHLEGDAYLWYQLLQQEVGIVTWEEFIGHSLNSNYRQFKFKVWAKSILGFLCRINSFTTNKFSTRLLIKV